MNTNEVVISVDDAELISNLVGSGGLPSFSGSAGEALAASLDTAKVVPTVELPSTVVSMNSIVEYVEVPGGTIREIMLVHPAGADVAAGRVSVLSPVGRALLGRSVGAVCHVTVPGGQKLVVKISGVVSGDRRE